MGTRSQDKKFKSFFFYLGMFDLSFFLFFFWTVEHLPKVCVGRLLNGERNTKKEGRKGGKGGEEDAKNNWPPKKQQKVQNVLPHCLSQIIELLTREKKVGAHVSFLLLLPGKIG